MKAEKGKCKEFIEKSLYKLKGNNNDAKKMYIFKNRDSRIKK